MQYWSCVALLVVSACSQSSQPAVSGSGERQTPAEPTARGAESAGTADAAPAPIEPVRLSLDDLGFGGLDTTVDPCTDFYAYACSGFGAGSAHPVTRLEMHRRQLAASLTELLDSADSPPGKLYRQCADTAARDRAGLKALEPLRRKLAEAKSEQQLSRVLGELHRHQIWALFSVAAAPDFADGRETILHLDRTLPLGDRDFYLDAKDAPDEGEDFAKLRKRYEELIEDAMELAGASSSEARRIANDALSIERALARAARSRYERRAATMLYDRVDRKGLAELAPRIDWKAYFGGLGTTPAAISVTSRNYLDEVGDLWRSRSSDSWRRYLDWQIVWHMAPHASTELARVRRSIEELVGPAHATEESADDCLARVAEAVPDEIAEILRSTRMPDPRGARLRELLEAMVEAHAVRISGVAWLTAETRKRAAGKLAAVELSLPEPTPAAASTTGKSYLATLLSARARQTDRQLAAVKEGSRHWVGIDPLSPGPRYDWLGNRLVVPPGAYGLARLDSGQPLAVALGVLAATAGHELAHVFDARGARWNTQGGIGTWWEAGDDAGYLESSACLIDRARRYRGPGAPIDGRAVVAETRADRAGIEAGYHAYRKLADQDAERFELEGIDRARLFFVAAANALCAIDPAGAGSTPRGPARWRVNATIADIPAFAEAFRCKPGTPMNPAKRCQ